MKAFEIIDSLKSSRPDVAITVEWIFDEYCAWDGDGPDPEDEGYFPHDVDVTATTIRNGVILTGTASLGGCYSPLDGPHCPEIHGYAAQLIEDALADLDKQL